MIQLHSVRAPTAVKEVRHIGLMGEELAAFLNTLKTVDPAQFHAVEKAQSCIHRLQRRIARLEG